MSFQEGVHPPNEDLVASALGVNGHTTSPPYESGYPVEDIRRDDSIVPVVSDITPSIIPNSLPSAKSHHLFLRSPAKETQLPVIIKSSPAPSSKRQALYSSPGARTRDELALEIQLPSRPQPRKAQGGPAGPAAIFRDMRHEGEEAAPPPRKRGRPKGWKPGTPYSTNKGESSSATSKPSRKPKSSSAAANQEPRRRGRPPKPPDLTVRQWYMRSNPKYMPFGCEWHEENLKGQLTRCPAELQNMDTLRKHVYRIHCDTESLVCRWGKCGNGNLSKAGVDEETVPEETEAEHQQQQLEDKQRPEEFTNEDALRAHIEKEHLEPYVWHMGDGPQNKGIWTLKQDPNQLQPYLFGQDGSQVTPSTKDQQFEDVQGTMDRKRKLRAIQRQALENAPDESEFLLQPSDTEY